MDDIASLVFFEYFLLMLLVMIRSLVLSSPLLSLSKKFFVSWLVSSILWNCLVKVVAGENSWELLGMETGAGGGEGAEGGVGASS